ncbi:MAG TPA: hypothetical protein VLG38_04710 [Gammaproteobacteria bacterium]|nr:hypothetical protein [Gammaproteobacteria bacterium]
MVKKTKNINPDAQNGEEGEGGESGSSGKGGKGSIFLASYDELVAVSPEEAEIARAAKDAVFAQRVSLKSQGNKVAALDRKQELRNKLSDPRVAAELAAGGGSNLEEHPELPELGGAFDDIAFPEAEIEAAAANDPQLRNALKARMGMGMSVEALRYELENKNKEKLRLSARPAPEERLKYTIRPSAPPPKPRPF